MHSLRMMRSTLCSLARKQRLRPQLQQHDIAPPRIATFQLASTQILTRSIQTDAALNNDHSLQREDPDWAVPIRLSKRMSELGICSRREAAKILKEASECRDDSSLKFLKEVIYLGGKPVMGGAAVKVPPGEEHIEIRAGDDPPDESDASKTYVSYANRPWDEIQGDTIVLNKPVGYVSGQEEHQHVPAVRLLTKANMHLDEFDKEAQNTIRKGSSLHFDQWKFSGYDLMSNSVPRHIRKNLSEEELNAKSRGTVETLSGYAPTGRLDIDSTGILIFSRAGIMARRLIEPNSNIAKEYIVTVEPAVQLTAREQEMGLKSLPRPTRDLSLLRNKGNMLWDEPKPLKPLLEAEWLDIDENQQEQRNKKQKMTMRLVLVEGKKRQIRRMCRELLGWHVVELVRTSVGPVPIDDLPEGKWRPLLQEEVTAIFGEQVYTSKPKTDSNSETDSVDIVDHNAQIGWLKETTPSLPAEMQVVELIKSLQKKHRGTKFTIPKFRKMVETSLSYKAEKKGEKKKWRLYLRHIMDANSL